MITTRVALDPPPSHALAPIIAVGDMLAARRACPTTLPQRTLGVGQLPVSVIREHQRPPAAVRLARRPRGPVRQRVDVAIGVRVGLVTPPRVEPQRLPVRIFESV